MKKIILGVYLLLCAFFVSAQTAPNDNVSNLRGNNGSKYTFTTTGTLEGSLWGGMEGVYTDDSKLGKAAVHAGILRPGETGSVTITILAGRSRYLGSMRNGIHSSDYGSWGGSFQFNEVSKARPNVAEAPAIMKDLRGNNGTTYTYVITGTSDGSVWGGADGVYTDDSKLSTAAVHAGILKVGESASVKVTVLQGQEAYKGSTQNGITSNNYGPWQGSFSFGNISKPSISNAPTNMTGYRGKIGQVFTFNVVGSNSGTVWGGANGIYTDDSPLSTAAVHAGKVRVGEEAVIRVRVVAPKASYQGNNKNGITTKNYGAFQGSYVFE
ncbi:MAG: hypothetical protein IPO02_16155 [Bacteroidetes bacterium]|nr:hypothetical protein [Bacteroidota bacterium]